MKIYTRTGDSGQTGRLAGDRVSKHHPQIEACGDVDELNSALGCAVATGLTDEHAEIVKRIQHELFTLGAFLAGGDNLLTSRDVQALESDIDQLDGQLPPLTQFILPGGSPAASALHLARATCRRAERRVVELDEQTERSLAEAIVYLNRLADLLFVVARSACLADGAAEVHWQQPT